MTERVQIFKVAALAAFNAFCEVLDNYAAHAEGRHEQANAHFADIAQKAADLVGLRAATQQLQPEHAPGVAELQRLVRTLGGETTDQTPENLAHYVLAHLEMLHDAQQNPLSAEQLANTGALDGTYAPHCSCGAVDCAGTGAEHDARTTDRAAQQAQWDAARGVVTSPPLEAQNEPPPKTEGDSNAT